MWLNYIDLAPARISGSNTLKNSFTLTKQIVRMKSLASSSRMLIVDTNEIFPRAMNVATALRSHYGCQMINLKLQAGAVLNMCDGIT